MAGFSETYTMTSTEQIITHNLSASKVAADFWVQEGSPLMWRRILPTTTQQWGRRHLIVQFVEPITFIAAIVDHDAQGYNHIQSTPSNSWVVTHNFNSEVVTECIIDINGTKERAYPYDIVKVDSNTVRFDFTEPQTGAVRIMKAS